MIKLSGLLNEERWEAKDGRISLNGKPIMDYEFDHGSDSFWVADPKKKHGQLSFDTKDEMIAFAKKSGIRTWKSSVHEGSDDQKEKVTQLLIKWGNNRNDVKDMVDKHYDYVCKHYSNASPKIKAEVIRTIYSKGK